MKHYLTFKDGRSDKFWRIEVSGHSFTVTYGKAGTTGVSQTKTFGSNGECLRAAEKLLAEKIKKGYLEDGAASPSPQAQPGEDYLNSWQGIVNDTNWRVALEKHFSYLADMPSAKQLLAAIMKDVKGVTCDAESLMVTFSELELHATPPASSIPKTYPKSFQNILSRHKTITISKYDTTLGEHGMFNLEDGWFDEVDDEADEILQVFAKAKRHLCPISEGTSGNFWIYHPKEKNSFGEPMIYYLEHDGMLIENPQEGNAGSVFLDILASSLDITIEPSAAVKYPKEPEEWWNAVGQVWQAIFERSLWEKMGPGFSKEKIKKIKSLDRLTISREIILSDLDPLLSLPNLKSLRIYTGKIASYNAISQIAKLKELEIHAGVYPLEILSSLINLEKLELRGDHITSLEGLSKLTKLTQVKIQSGNLTAIDSVSNYPLLKVLYIGETKVSDISLLNNVKTLSHVELPSTVTTLTPFKDLPKLYYLNIRACVIPLSDMVDFISYRKDGFSLLIHNYWELLHQTFRHKLQGIEDKVAIWFSCWIRIQGIIDHSTLILVALYYYLEDRKYIPKKFKDFEVAKDALEKKLNKVTTDSVNCLYRDVLFCAHEERLEEARALIKALSNVAEKSPDLRILIKDEQKITLHSAVDNLKKELFKVLYNKNNRYIKEGKLAESKSLVIQFVEEFRAMNDVKEILSGIKMAGSQSGKEMSFLESFVSDVIVLSLMTKDVEIEKIAMELAPEQITDDVLAFNLACFFAVKRNKPQLLNYLKIAITLGKKREEFMVDSDFGWYRQDPEFLSALDHEANK